MIDEQYKLRPFVSVHADQIVRWVSSPSELFMLAPLTPPPLTRQKVCSWACAAHHPFVYVSGWERPVAYGELNEVPLAARQFWVGHFVVAPHARSRNIGRRFLWELLDEAFGPHGADSVTLVVFPENDPAIRCYRSVGFVDVGPQRRRFPAWRGTYVLRQMKLVRRAYRWAVHEGDGLAPPAEAARNPRHVVADWR